MSSHFAKSLSRYLEQLVVGPPLCDAGGALQGMVVYPIFPQALHPDPPDTLTLSEALKRGVRLRDTGIISRIHVDNPLPAAILAGESEILLGPTQLRAVQFSCLLPAARRSSLPVTCVEEGRPAQHLAEFMHTDACPWSLRSFKMQQMAQRGEPLQYWIWDSIRSYLSATDTPSTTLDVHAVLDRHALELRRLGSAFPYRPGQVGTVCAVGQEFFLELFGDPEMLEDRYPLVLRSALVEALARPQECVLPPEQVPFFLEQVVVTSQTSRLLDNRGLRPEGRSLVFASPTVSGSALVAHGHLVHLTARQHLPGMTRPYPELWPQLKAMRSTWEDEHAGLVGQLSTEYASRRERYQVIKERLQPAAGPVLPTASEGGAGAPSEPVAPVARPLPLSRPLHAFFMRLFCRT